MKQTAGLIVLYKPGEYAVAHELQEVLPGVGGVVAYQTMTTFEAFALARKVQRRGGYQRKRESDPNGDLRILAVIPNEWDYQTTLQGFSLWCAIETQLVNNQDMGGFNAN